MLRGLSGRITAAALAALVTAGALGACGDDGGGSAADAPLRLGFPNTTHATALVGVEKGIFAEHLGTAPKTATFNAGPAAVEALFSGAIDATFVGPNPSINAWSKSHGKAVHIISGAASGGVSLVVKPGIKGVQDLRGKKIATPQLGNTQDVALRYWLKQNGLAANKDGSGDVKVVPQENAQTLQTFAQGDIDGAWVPEPYASRLILESKGEAAGREVAVARRQVRHHERAGQPGVREEAPGPGEEAAPGRRRGDRLHQPEQGGRPEGHQRRADEAGSRPSSRTCWTRRSRRSTSPPTPSPPR